MKSYMKNIIAGLAAAAMTITCSLASFASASDYTDSIVKDHENRVIPYDNSSFSTMLDPEDSAIHPELTIESKELEYSSDLAGSVQNIKFTLSGTQDNYSAVALHIYYDNRMKPVLHGKSYAVKDAAAGDLTVDCQCYEDGELYLVAYSGDATGTDGVAWSIDFELPATLSAGDTFPIGVEYYKTLETSDCFQNVPRNMTYDLMEAWFFVNGIHNGYIRVNGKAPETTEALTTAESTTSESTVQSTTSESTVQSTTSESTVQSTTSESTVQSTTSESTVQSTSTSSEIVTAPVTADPRFAGSWYCSQISRNSGDLLPNDDELVIVLNDDFTYDSYFKQSDGYFKGNGTWSSSGDSLTMTGSAEGASSITGILTAGNNAALEFDDPGAGAKYYFSRGGKISPVVTTEETTESAETTSSETTEETTGSAAETSSSSSVESTAAETSSSTSVESTEPETSSSEAVSETPHKEYKLGDVDENDKVTTNDAAKTLAECAALANKKPSLLTARQRKAADMNYDGKISTMDAAYVLGYVAHLSSKETPKKTAEQWLADKKILPGDKK